MYCPFWKLNETETVQKRVASEYVESDKTSHIFDNQALRCGGTSQQISQVDKDCPEKVDNVVIVQSMTYMSMRPYRSTNRLQMNSRDMVRNQWYPIDTCGPRTNDGHR